MLYGHAKSIIFEQKSMFANAKVLGNLLDYIESNKTSIESIITNILVTLKFQFAARQTSIPVKRAKSRSKKQLLVGIASPINGSSNLERAGHVDAVVTLDEEAIPCRFKTPMPSIPTPD